MRDGSNVRSAKVTALLAAVWAAAWIPSCSSTPVEVVTLSPITESRSQECGFKCSSGICIGVEQVCDGVANCPDKDDETAITCIDRNVTCPEYAVRCDYGACVDSDARCNGIDECVDGSDEKECPTSKPNECSFRCKTGDCIQHDQLCDGTVHCPDKSDETADTCLNSSSACPEYAVRCDYGACVDADARCNGKEDCADGSDEKECPELATSGKCRQDEFKCSDNSCIEIHAVCDGRKDCSDGSDETHTQCNSILCPGYTFRCDYGACIDNDHRCDGQAHCVDESDEQPEMCATTTPRPCQSPKELKNGHYRVDLKTVKYSCHVGFTLLGADVSHCVDGEWTSKLPVCKKDEGSGSSGVFVNISGMTIIVSLCNLLVIGILPYHFLMQ